MEYTMNEEYTENEYFTNDDYEEDRLRETAELNRRFIRSFEEQYGCTFPEFILKANTEKDRIDLILWANAVRHLALAKENVYSFSNL